MPNHEGTATPQQRAKSQNKDFLKQSLKKKKVSLVIGKKEVTFLSSN